MAFYEENELKKIGFKKIGKNVQISRLASIYTPENIEIGNNVRIDDFCFLIVNIKLGNYIHIGSYTALYGKYGIEMEDFSGLSSRCLLFTASDDYSGNSLTNPMIPAEYKKINSGKIKVGKHSIVGAGTIILPNIVIEEGVSVGANSLVTKSLKAWGIYFGNPVKLLRERSKNLLKLEQEFLKSLNRD